MNCDVACLLNVMTEFINWQGYHSGCFVLCNKFFGEGLSLSGIIEDQEKIGWNNFALGRWSPLWQHAQRLHYESIGSKKSANSLNISLED